jgi:pimeloyl-ACP methyl ester carboxylesterase
VLAGMGYRVWAVNQRGYGRTTGPPCGAGSSVRVVTAPVLASMPTVVEAGVGNHPGGGFTLQSGCPAGSAFQNMILSK